MGGAGHSGAIAAKLGSGKLICVDRDETALQAAGERLEPWKDRVTLVHSNFDRVPEILDDLGMERDNGFTVSVIYEVINARLRSGKSTVISSNLSAEEISSRYNPQVSSRLAGEYENLKFYGRDIRKLKKEE